ncbi:hypothetical protein JTE90_015666 [Oedothorax gibbosus]|uniref:Uncharacterized protein n=1 Tax=Oedothorax gibbosus TaxID=931172 RepID=A0AAV6UHI4_9ARAC|nr:hypothetical protein JTE90_015666 [Oedothorax gibbosus]
MLSNVNSVWVSAVCVILVLRLTSGRPSLIPSLNSRGLLWKLADYASSGKSFSSKNVQGFPSNKSPTKDCNCKCEKLEEDENSSNAIDPVPTTSTTQAPMVRQPTWNIPPLHLMPPSCLSNQRKRRVRPNTAMYPIGDIKFDIDTRRSHLNLNATVIVECDFLYGLDDFQKTNWDLNRPDDYILIWRKLKTRCPISVLIDGVKEGRGDAAIVVERLFMHVKLTLSGDMLRLESNSLSMDVQMSEVKKVNVDIQDLGGFLNDYIRPISAEIEKTVLCVVNSEIRNVLKDSMRCFQDGASTSCALTS